MYTIWFAAFFIALLLITLFWYIYTWHKKPHTLSLGISFLALLGAIGLLLLFLGFTYSEAILQNSLAFTILALSAFVVLLLILFFPTVFWMMYFIEGIRVIRKEGLRFSNMLSLLFSIGLVVYLFFYPLILVRSHNLFTTLLYFSIGLCVVYFLTLFMIFCFSSFLNLVHFGKKKNLDVIVVLGAGILKTKVTPLLASRIEKGIALQKANPHALLILSGGQGPGEDIPEGAAMKSYAINHGADPARTISEEASLNTWQNLEYSRKLFPQDAKKIAIVSTGYHVFRALVIADQQGLKAMGYGSKTKWYFTLNAILREYIGWLKLTWKKRLIPLGILLVISWIFIIGIQNIF